ncbi:MAG: hypothetical protein OEW70_03620 [candidate division WOR-3 bacterium]|nr:hypothetical protein [candidate division WOR-3 bacterium]
MKFFEALMKIDRRILYLVLAAVVIIPFIFPFMIHPKAMPPVENLYNYIDSIPQDKALVISVDYTPDTEPELHPMTIALLRHAFTRRIKVGVLCIGVLGLGLAENALNQVAGEFNQRATSKADSIIYGRDYVFWGWQTPVLTVILGMGERISRVFTVDYYNNQTETLPMMKQIKNYNNVGILVSVSASASPGWYITYGQTSFGVKVGIASTAVQAADWYPYLNSGQATGMLSGMKGGAEYEELVQTNLGITDRRRATEAMASQTSAHFAIIVFILIGNIGYFVLRRRKK